jgi:NTP pyrophosphatase (non-canonical NTP hydrolase)
MSNFTNKMTLDEYQALAVLTAQYPDKDKSIMYSTLKLAGESGEFAEKVGKYYRNFEAREIKDYTPEQKIELIKELGDVQWYIADLALRLGFTLGDVAKINLEKLKDRQIRNVIKSEGDNR